MLYIVILNHRSMHYLFVISFMLIAFCASSQSEELTLNVDSAILSATLLNPDENPSKSVALFFSGSGATDRDGNPGPQYKNNSLKMLAEGLAKEGIASLRFDKRGVGKSEFEGNEANISFDDFVNDGRSFLEYLKNDVRYERYYVIGHS